MRLAIHRLTRGGLVAWFLLLPLAVAGGEPSSRPKRRPRRSPWRYIVIHHSATRKGNATSMGRYHSRRRHMANGLAYHFVINNGTSGRLDGEVEEGMRWTRQIPGGHVRQSWLNESGIGICLVGNFNRHSPTRKQMDSLVKLVDRLRKTYGIPVSAVKGHKEFGGEHTECPGRYFSMARFRDRLAENDLREARRKAATVRAASRPGTAIPSRGNNRI